MASLKPKFTLVSWRPITSPRQTSAATTVRKPANARAADTPKQASEVTTSISPGLIDALGSNAGGRRRLRVRGINPVRRRLQLGTY
jgi:hypothetical protein